MAHDVFISYSHADEDAAEAICEGLEAAGINCWIAPRNIAAGEEWAYSIFKAIEEATAVILVFTDSSNGSRHVLREISRAVGCDVEIIPFKLTPTEPDGSMGYYLETVHWLDVSDLTLDEGIARLINVVRFSMSRKAKAAEAPVAEELVPAKTFASEPAVLAPVEQAAIPVVAKVADAPVEDTQTGEPSANSVLLAKILIGLLVVLLPSLLLGPIYMAIQIAEAVLALILLRRLGEKKFFGILLGACIGLIILIAIWNYLPMTWITFLTFVLWLACVGISIYAAYVTLKAAK